MVSPLRSLVSSGTKLWLDSIDPALVIQSKEMGATGATSNPIIIADLLKTGRFDGELLELAQKGLSDSDVAWTMTDRLVSSAEHVFFPVWESSKGDDGYVSFELDPLLEDQTVGPLHEKRVAAYIELGKKWAKGHQNRMIKVPATPAGLAALEDLAAEGIPLNVTLIFSKRQYRLAREAVWRGAQKRNQLGTFKSVFSIFVSRLDVYTEKFVPQLSASAQGQVGILNAKEIWAENQEFWRQHPTPLNQEIVFASTGTKKPEDPCWKYVAAFAGSDIETNPPQTNNAVEASGQLFKRAIDLMPDQAVVQEIHEKVDAAKLEETLMNDGLAKFAEPQKALIALIGEKRKKLSI
jgi:transaldolase